MPTRVGLGSGAGDLPWLAACVALGGAWIALATGRGRGRRLDAALRGLLGGLAAFGAAMAGYDVLQLAGVTLDWGLITGGTWAAAGLALLVGLLEEGAKLIGVVLAAPPWRDRSPGVLRTSLAVVSVFAVAEAALALQGAGWAVGLTRLAFGPVAHAALAAPFAVVLSERDRGGRGRLALRLAVALVAAASLHGFGDWSVAHRGWGRLAFAVSLLAPTLWFYAQRRRAAAPGLVGLRSVSG